MTYIIYFVFVLNNKKLVELKSITHELIFKYPFIALLSCNCIYVCIIYVTWAGGLKANKLLSLSHWFNI